MRAALTTAIKAGIGYEDCAFASRGRMPTITALCAGRPWLALGVLGVLGVHLLWQPSAGSRTP